MGLADFLKKSNANAPKKFDPNAVNNDKLAFVFMNAPVHMGVIKFVPITSLSGAEIRYLYDVSEFQVHSTNDDGETYWRWGKVLQSGDYLTQLTQEQIDKVNQIHSMINGTIDLGYGTDWARNGKNYAVFFGYILQHVNSDKEVLTSKESRKMALIVCPSKNVAKAMVNLGESLDSSANGDQQFEMLFNRNSEDRKLFLEMSFKRSSGFGYDVIINPKTFDLMSSDLLTKEEATNGGVTIPEELIAQCTEQSAIFLGNHDEDGKDYVEEFVNTLHEQVKGELDKSVAKNKAAENLPPVPPIDPDANKPKGEGWNE